MLRAWPTFLLKKLMESKIAKIYYMHVKFVEEYKI